MVSALPTRQAILNQLRYQPLTIAELQASLGLTRNAVMLPLGQLESAGLVRRLPIQRDGRVGKPSQRYELAPEEFEQQSAAYQAIAPHLLAMIGRPEAVDRQAAMKAVGNAMHREAAASRSGGERLGLERAVQFLQEHGAEIEIQADRGDTLVLSHSCPIGRLVRTDRCICEAVASFLETATGRTATSECVYADKLTCRFRIKKEPAHAAQAPV